MDPSGKLLVTVIPAAKKAKAGETIRVDTVVQAEGGTVKDVKVLEIKAGPNPAVLGGKCKAPYGMDDCIVGAAGTLTSGQKTTIASTLRVPDSIKKNVTVTLSVTIGVAGQKDPEPTTAQVAYEAPKPAPTKKPTKSPSPTLSPGKGKGPADGKAGKDKDGSSNGDPGSTPGGSPPGGSGTGGSGTNNGGFVPPVPNSSFDPRNPQVALPPIAAPNPSVAPSPEAAAPASRLRNNKAPVAQELTFDRMASTQIAWLAALMVAFSLLMTQLRLGRRVPPGSAAAAQARRAKGTHRRAKRGTFAK